MSLTSGKGPLGHHRVGWFSAPVPPGTVFVEPHPRRIQAEVEGRIVLDTERALLVHRVGHMLAYAFPVEEAVGLPTEPAAHAPGFVTVPWEAADAWYEEGRRLVNYPPNPYHRVDCRPTTRRLRVEVAGTELVDTTDTVIVFETSLEPVLYVARTHVRTDLLRRSETTTYWSALVGEAVVEDVAWSYDDPLPESSPIAGMLSFDPDRADVLAQLPEGWTAPPDRA